MANRFNRKNMNNMGGGMGGGQRRFNNYERGNFDRYGMNPWQEGVAPNAGGPAAGADATLALANNLINNLLRRQNQMPPSLLDVNPRRDFGGPNYMREDRFGNKQIGRNMQMGGQMNRRVASGGRNDRMMNKIRRPMRPNTINKAKTVQKVNQDKKETSENKGESVAESKNAEGENGDNAAASNAEGEDGAKDGEGADDKQTDSKKAEGVKTEFDGIASEFLECHICEKKMWDGRSFDNHIKGRVHNIMMDKTKQSYHMTADAMRQELKINEMKRNKRGFVPGAKKVFCAMCDLFVFHAASHRRSPGHQKLKKYLHPSCNTCRKEFSTRIELDEHRLTAPHMQLLQEKQKDVQSRPKPEVVMISTLQDELNLIKTKPENKKKAAEVKTEGTEGAEAPADGEKKEENSATEEGEGVTVKNETEEPPQEEVVLLLDYKEGDDLTDVTRENVPRYKNDRPVGPSFITEFSCKHCTLCKKYFDTDETAEVHLRTYKHFIAYIQLIHSKGNFKAQENAAAAAKREAEANADGSAKRMKTEDDANNEEEERLLNGNGDTEMQDTTACDESQELSLLETSNATTDNDTTFTGATSEPVEEVVNQSVAEPEVGDSQIGKSPRPNRGRGRGRGNRARRGNRF